jgi:cell division septal protein FtsQ
LFENREPRNILRTPKVFQAPRDEERLILPKIIKILIIAVILFLGLVYLFLFSPVFQIKNIEIVGSPSDEVKKILDGLKGLNIFSFHAQTLEQNIIAKNQNYLSVRIDRGLPDTVRVKFQDREAKIVWQTRDQLYFVDKDAILFQKAEDSGGLSIVKDLRNLEVTFPAQIATTNFVDFVRSAQTEIAQSNLIIQEFQIDETTFQLEALTDKGFKIIFNTLRPLSEQIDAFRTVYEKNKDQIKEYIDLRVEGWVYYK